MAIAKGAKLDGGTNSYCISPHCIGNPNVGDGSGGGVGIGLRLPGWPRALVAGSQFRAALFSNCWEFHEQLSESH